MYLTLTKASISLTASIKSRIKGFNLCSSSIDCGVYLTLTKASISPTAGMKSGIKGFNLCSSSIDCGVYLKKNASLKYIE